MRKKYIVPKSELWNCELDDNLLVDSSVSGDIEGFDNVEQNW